MNTSRFESIDHTVQLTHEWINELDELLGWDNKSRSYRLLRNVLQAVHDWLPVNDAAHLGAQLPTLLRGVYYEHWRPAATPARERDRDSFLARIDRAFETDPIDDTASAVTEVFRVLSTKVSSGEIQKVRHALPGHIRDLWPAP
jgi:uncharacterized protein (DUF2267 family)